MRSKFRSVSVDDLENVVKQLIQSALKNDAEETIQLEMTVCGEEYYRKIAKIKTENSQSEHVLKISNCGEESPESNSENDTFPIINNCTGENELNKEKSNKNLNENLILNNSNKCSRTSMDPKIEKNEIIENYHKTHEIDETKDSKPIVKKNLRSKLTEHPKADEKEKETSQETIQSKGDFSFEAWKAAKTRAYKLMLKKEKRKQQRELLANAKKLEKEKAAHMVYSNWKRGQQQQQKLKRMHVKSANETMMASEVNTEKKRYANAQAFQEWKKRKEAKIRKEKMMWRAYGQQNNQHNSATPVQTESNKNKTNINFDNWLEQVDHVLHQKYVRERRFQVRSFYCQPTYYGAAALFHQ